MLTYPVEVYYRIINDNVVFYSSLENLLNCHPFYIDSEDKDVAKTIILQNQYWDDWGYVSRTTLNINLDINGYKINEFSIKLSPSYDDEEEEDDDYEE